MALDTAPLLSKKKNLAFSLETTTGTAATLAAADGVTNIFNPSMAFNTESVDRESQGNLSAILQGLGARAAACQFESELVGNGTTGQSIQTRLLKMCGMSDAGVSGTFKPVTGDMQTGTIGYYQHGRLKKMVGAMGSFRLVIRRGQKGRWFWNFLGVQAPPGDVTQILPTYVTVKAPRAGATTLTIGGTTFRIPEIEIAQTIQPVLREDLTALDSNSEATGYRNAYLTNRRFEISISPEALPLSTQDWYSVYRNQTTSALSCVVGDAANNIHTLAAPAMQLITNPEDEDREGLMADRLRFLCVRSAALGDDEFTYAIS